MLELVFLLLPVAAASGWLVGRRSLSAGKKNNRSDLSSDYFKGLNYLLNEQPDKAIEVFIRMLEVDNETVETHMALGNLFRRRGEVDRAIRIHQNLIARPTLTRSQRAEALYELGVDYMRAGLLDRAESLFQQLIEHHDRIKPALSQLLDIYQQEKDWEKGIAAARKLEDLTAEPQGHVISHYYCELAEQALEVGKLDVARQMIKRALSSNRDSVRASIIQGDIEKSSGNWRAAIKAYKRIEQQNADYLPEIVPPLLECYRKQNNSEEAIRYLEQMLQVHGGITVTLALAELVRARDGDKKAIELITDYLHKRPSVRGMERLVELNIASSEGEVQGNLMIIKDLTSKLLENNTTYTCSHCGFTGRSMHWQCPGCKHWDTVKQKQGVVGD